MTSTARRALLGSVVAGGLVVTQAAPTGAATTVWNPRTVRAFDLRVGDLVTGPDATVVRISVRTTLASGRVLLRYTDPRTGAPLPFDAANASIGYRAGRRFAVLARDVVEAAVRFDVAPQPVAPLVIDGGTP